MIFEQNLSHDRQSDGPGTAHFGPYSIGIKD